MSSFYIDLKGLLAILSDLLIVDVTIAEMKTILYFLCTVITQSGSKIKINRREISEVTGISRKQVGTAIKSLQQKGILSTTMKTAELSSLFSYNHKNEWDKTSLFFCRELIGLLKMKTPVKHENIGHKVEKIVHSLYSAKVTQRYDSNWVQMTYPIPYIYTHTQSTNASAFDSQDLAKFILDQSSFFPNMRVEEKPRGLEDDQIDLISEIRGVMIPKEVKEILKAFNKVKCCVTNNLVIEVHNMVYDLLERKKLMDKNGDIKKGVGEWITTTINEWILKNKNRDVMIELDKNQTYVESILNFFNHSNNTPKPHEK